MAKSDQDPQQATILHGEIFTQPRFMNVNHMRVQIREKVQHLQLNWDSHWFCLAVTQCSNLVLRSFAKSASLNSVEKTRTAFAIERFPRHVASLVLPQTLQPLHLVKLTARKMFRKKQYVTRRPTSCQSLCPLQVSSS